MTVSFPLPDDWFDPGAQSVESFADKIVAPLNELAQRLGQSGTAQLTITTANTDAQTDVVFAEPFTSIPVITLGMDVVSCELFSVSHVNKSLTGFSIRLSRNGGTGSWPVDWSAKLPTQ